MLRSSWRNLYVLEHACREFEPAARVRTILACSVRSYHQASSTALPGISDDFVANYEGGRTFFSSNKQANGGEEGGKPSGEEEKRVSDEEWALRTGRAIDILTQSLPKFFHTGLVNTNYHLPLGGGLHSLLERNGKGKGHANEASEGNFGIYSRNIRLEYNPPTALPAPFPRVLTLDGLSLYVASSAFVRHSMNALYTDLQVVARKASLLDNSSLANSRREKSFVISLLVSGTGRLGLVTSSEAEWDVTATYTFSPASGLIMKHTVNSIDPAPHETVFAALRTSLMKLGLAGQQGAGGADVIPGKLNGAVNSQMKLQSIPITSEKRRRSRTEE